MQSDPVGERPFFLFLNYFDAHWPCEPPPELATKWTRPGASPLTRDEHVRIWQEILGDQRDLREAERGTMVDAYDPAILSMDRSIRRLFEAPRTRGDDNETVMPWSRTTANLSGIAACSTTARAATRIKQLFFCKSA